jgi:UBX domain-containing protein 7
MPFDSSVLGKIAVEDEDEELARAIAASLEVVIEASDASDDDMAEAEPKD